MNSKKSIALKSSKAPNWKLRLMYWPLISALPALFLFGWMFGAFDESNGFGAALAGIYAFVIFLALLFISIPAAIAVVIAERRIRKFHFWFASLELVVAIAVGYISYAQPSIFFYHEEERCTILGCND